MHEFSLEGEVIKLARQEAEKNKALAVSKITIEVGKMSGIEPEAFNSALSLLSEGSILENSCINILRINGKGICIACGKEFEMNRRMDTGPYCHHNIYSDGLCKRMIPFG